MTDRLLFLTTLLSALGCGLVAGAFFAFSAFVMAALDRLPPAQGIAAMKSINVTAVTFWFMGAIFGTAVLCLVLAVLSVRMWGEPGSAFLLAGALIYLVITVGVTIAFNVPLNDALAMVDADSTEGAAKWATYVPDWTAWNHVRTVGALLATASLIAGLGRQAQHSGMPF